MIFVLSFNNRKNKEFDSTAIGSTTCSSVCYDCSQQLNLSTLNMSMFCNAFSITLQMGQIINLKADVNLVKVQVLLFIEYLKKFLEIISYPICSLLVININKLTASNYKIIIRH